MRFYWLLLLALLPFLYSFSPDSAPTTVAELQAQYRLLVDLQEQQEITPAVFEARAASLQTIANERFNLSLEGLAMEQALTAQRVNWIASALYVVAALLVFLLLGPLLRKLWKPLRHFFRQLWHLEFIRKLAALLKQLILLLWEPLAYVALVACLVLYPAEWLVVLAAFALGSLISYSVYSRRKKEQEQTYGNLASWMITVVWAGLGYYFDNAWIGFMAVGAFISSMGFVMVMWTRTIGIGFKEYTPLFILRLTGIMFVITLLAWLIFHTEYVPALTALRQPLRVYEVGLLSLVPLVYFLGLGYTAFFTFGRKAAVYKQVLARVVAFGAGYLTVGAGLLYGIGSLFWIGLFFMLWFTVDLYFEVIYRKIDVVWSGLVLALCLGGVAYWLRANLSVVLEFAVGLGW